MNFRWLGPLALLAVLVIADQVRINRPGHKYRLTVEVETPEGVKSASGILAVQPDRGYSRSGQTRTMGDAVLLDLGGGNNLIALLAHVDKTVELDGMNYLALRAYNTAGRKVSFNDMSRMTGPVPVQGALIPVLVTFHLHGISVEVVPNGFWPLDFGGPLGEPVTRGIEAKLPWWNRPDNPAGKALQAAGLQGGEANDPKLVFTRK